MSADERTPGKSPLGSKLLLVLLDNRRKRYPLEKRLGAELKGRRKDVLEEIRFLAGRGLVRVEAPEGGEPDLSKARSVEITDAGEEYVLSDLEVNPGCRVTGAAFFGTVVALRERLRAGAERAMEARPEAPPAPVAPGRPGDAPPAPPPSAGEVRDAIARAFFERERAQRGYVPIHEVRRHLAHVDRASFDAALLSLQGDGVLYLNKLNDPRDVPEDQIRDGIQSELRGRLFFISRGEKPWTQPTPS